MHGLQSGSVYNMDTRDGRVTHTLGRMKQARNFSISLRKADRI